MISDNGYHNYTETVQFLVEQDTWERCGQSIDNMRGKKIS